MTLAPTVASRFNAILMLHLGIDSTDITPNVRIVHDLGADSLDTIELMAACEDEFDITIVDDEIAMANIATVESVVAYLEKRIAEQHA